MSKLVFDTNVPHEVCLDTLEGETAESQFGGAQIKFTTTDRDFFYVSEAVGNIITDTCHKLKIEAREPVVICKAEVNDGRGRKSIRWQVNRVNAVGAQANGTFSVPANGHVANSAAPAANGNGANGSHPSAPPVATATAIPTPHPVSHSNGLEHTGWALHLREQANALIDIFADCLRHAAKHEGVDIAAEDVRSIVLSCYINVSKNGGGR